MIINRPWNFRGYIFIGYCVIFIRNIRKVILALKLFGQARTVVYRFQEHYYTYSTRPESPYVSFTLQSGANRPITASENVTFARSQSHANTLATCFAQPMNWENEVSHMIFARHRPGFE